MEEHNIVFARFSSMENRNHGGRESRWRNCYAETINLSSDAFFILGVLPHDIAQTTSRGGRMEADFQASTYPTQRQQTSKDERKSGHHFHFHETLPRTSVRP
uniref:Uncharacterized protein n=1 Tax=Salix viminalis TaxID=40686 RepID=A0A6N2LMW3_SALVM